MCEFASPLLPPPPNASEPLWQLYPSPLHAHCPFSIEGRTSPGVGSEIGADVDVASESSIGAVDASVVASDLDLDSLAADGKI